MAGRPDPDEAAEVVDEADEVVDEVGGGVVVVPDDEEPEEQAAQSSAITATAPTSRLRRSGGSRSPIGVSVAGRRGRWRSWDDYYPPGCPTDASASGAGRPSIPTGAPRCPGTPSVAGTLGLVRLAPGGIT